MVTALGRSFLSVAPARVRASTHLQQKSGQQEHLLRDLELTTKYRDRKSLPLLQHHHPISSHHNGTQGSEKREHNFKIRRHITCNKGATYIGSEATLIRCLQDLVEGAHKPGVGLRMNVVSVAS